jgi:hypothetical protein
MQSHNGIDATVIGPKTRHSRVALTRVLLIDPLEP